MPCSSEGGKGCICRAPELIRLYKLTKKAVTRKVGAKIVQLFNAIEDKSNSHSFAHRNYLYPQWG